MKHLYSQFVTTARKHLHISVAAGVFLLMLIGGMTLALVDRKDAPKAAASTLAANTGSAGKKTVNTASTEPVQFSTNPPAGQKPASTNTKPKAPAAPAPTNSQKTLKISPNSFTASPGESFPITIQANDGRAINMPFASASGRAFLNFGGSPAKPIWSGQIVVSKVVAPGTYTFDVMGQASKTEFYRSTITLTIAQPTMNVTIQSLGYDAADDSIGYVVKINRLYGFLETVTDITADSTTEPGLGCYADMPDSNTINLTCIHDAGDRPTNGTLSVTVKTNSVVRSAGAPYSLPPL
jgi:hypothetical protein